MPMDRWVSGWISPRTYMAQDFRENSPSTRGNLPLWAHCQVPHSHKSSHRHQWQGKTLWCLQHRSSLPPRLWNSGRSWTGRWILLQGHRLYTPCEVDTSRSRSEYGSASQRRYLPWHRELHRPVHWHTLNQS